MLIACLISVECCLNFIDEVGLHSRKAPWMAPDCLSNYLHLIDQVGLLLGWLLCLPL